MNHKPFARLLILVLLIAVAGTAYGVFYGKVREHSAHLAELQDKAVTMSTDATRIAAAKEALTSLGKDEETAASYLVLASDIVPFLEELQKLGTELGAKVEIVSVSKEKVDGRERVFVSVKITGSFSPVLRTLGAIEHAPYDINTSQMSLALSADAGGLWTASGVFTVGTRTAK